MNWFQRYGIPGAYFLGLIIAWIWVMYPWVPIDTSLPTIGVIVGIFFIPAGYIISVIQQFLYLTIKSLGIHRAAKRQAGITFLPDDTDDEPTIEAYTLLLTARVKKMSIEQHKWIQDWIRRRMDVIAIDFSFIIATVLAPIIGLLFGIFILLPDVCSPWNSEILSCKATLPFAIYIFWSYTKIVLIFAISFVVCLIMWLSREKLKNQIILVIKDFYRQFT